MPRIATVQVPWPLRGLHRNFGYNNQPVGTTPDALNVRSYDPGSGRARGSQRAGLSKYLDAVLTGGSPIQCLNQVTNSGAYAGPSSMVVRTIRRVAVAGGNVALFDGTTFTAATGGTGALSATAPVIHSAELFGTVYFADGTNAKKWVGSTNTVSAITASAGSFPSNGANLPRLVCMWNERLIWSGLVGDEHNWFMSKKGFPLDYDYSPANTTEIQAVAGNVSAAGKIGDVVTCIAPWTNDRVVFGCDHSIWIMYGDPAAGGNFTQLSQVTGMAWGMPYCVDPYGTMWFFGSRGGVYRMPIDGGPERVTTDTIDELLATVDLTKTVSRLAWNDREQGVHLFLTALDGSDSTHYFLDTRNKGWWADRFATTDMNPVCVHVFDGDLPGDRAILLGAMDSRVYQWDIDAETDDGRGIDSYIFLGPIRTGKAMERIILRETQTTLADESGDVDYDVIAGNSVQQAVNATMPDFSGVWGNGRNPSGLRGARGDAIFYKLRSKCRPTRWSLENLQARVEVVSQEGQRPL